jgi:hypothetical protein
VVGTFFLTASWEPLEGRRYCRITKIRDEDIVRAKSGLGDFPIIILSTAIPLSHYFQRAAQTLTFHQQMLTLQLVMC